MLLLGAYHGINPGHGWLFAGGAGDASSRRRAQWRDRSCDRDRPALAIGSVVLAAAFLGRRLSPAAVRYPVGVSPDSGLAAIA